MNGDLWLSHSWNDSIHIPLGFQKCLGGCLFYSHTDKNSNSLRKDLPYPSCWYCWTVSIKGDFNGMNRSYYLLYSFSITNIYVLMHLLFICYLKLSFNNYIACLNRSLVPSLLPSILMLGLVWIDASGFISMGWTISPLKGEEQSMGWDRNGGLVLVRPTQQMYCSLEPVRLCFVVNSGLPVFV